LLTPAQIPAANSGASHCWKYLSEPLLQIPAQIPATNSGTNPCYEFRHKSLPRTPP